MIPRWIVTRVKISRWIVTPGHDSTLNCDPGSWFYVELWSQVKLWPGIGITIQCVILTRVIIQRGILTRGHNSTWNSDPSTYLLPVELRLNKVSKFNSVIKIQQLRRVTIQRKIHWILTPGRYSIGGSKFYLTPAVNYHHTAEQWNTCIPLIMVTGMCCRFTVLRCLKAEKFENIVCIINTPFPLSRM